MRLKTIVILVVAIIVIYLLVQFQRSYSLKLKKDQIDTNCHSISQDETIFVSLSSFLEPETTAETLIYLYEHCFCPSRIYVGVYQTLKETDRHCLVLYDKLVKLRKLPSFRENIRVLTADKNELCRARHVIETKLYKKEKYYLLLDSSCRLVSNWDQILIEELYRCSSTHPILTQQPERCLPKTNPFDTGQFQDKYSTWLCFDSWTKNGTVRTKTQRFEHRPFKPFKSLFWCSQFSFTFGNILLQVLHDPDFIFADESDYEWVMNMRFYTYGWDIFVPTSIVCATSTKKKTTQKENDFYLNRLYSILRLQPSIGCSYDIGTERSLADFQKYTGVDWFQRTTSWYAKSGTDVSPKPCVEEIICKYGSLTYFNS